ncbi:hypothetical protein K7J14_13280 [Treponema zuelzerae]|uniref:Uncharacterized protein n=1 Tax=Teretinema zuelzerae TaxID=156 RepID=A0AAE3JMF3_9SPIR|nr:hypothetical protein [Teretinema zuelzerae]MCD1655664.1 hypothetical protein [Teretinema zuelzerae]
MPSYAIIIPAAALCLLPACAAVVLLRLRKALRAVGPAIEKFSGKIRLQFIGVILASPLLVSLLFIRSFDPLSTFAIAGTGVIGFYIACQDLFFSRYCGVYARGIVWNGSWIEFVSVESWRRLDPYSLSLLLTGREKRIFAFPDSALLDRVSAVLARLMPPEEYADGLS